MTARRSRLCAVFACAFLASVASSGPAFTQEAVGIPATIQGDERDAQLEPHRPTGRARVRNVVHAADIWFSVKKHWCLEAQRYASASRISHRLRS